MEVSRKTKEKVAHINQEIESSLSGVRTAKAFANERENIFLLTIHLTNKHGEILC